MKFGISGNAVNERTNARRRIAALAKIGVTDFAAVEFGSTPDEAYATRQALKELLT